MQVVELAQRLGVAAGQPLGEAPLCAIPGGQSALHLATTYPYVASTFVGNRRRAVAARPITVAALVAKGDDQIRHRGSRGCAAARRRPAAAQARDPLAGGSTTLKLDAGVAKALKAAGVSRVRHRRTRSPAGRSTARRHRHDQPLGQPQVDGRADRADALSSFTVKLGKSSTLRGRVGKARVTLLTLDTSKAKIARDGLDTKITGVRVLLTSAAAKALNATFHTTLFKRGLRLGTVAVTAKPKTVELTGGATTVTLDPGAANALQSLGIAAAPIGSDSLAFPITGGKLDAKTFAGTITHSGGIALTKGATTRRS